MKHIKLTNGQTGRLLNISGKTANVVLNPTSTDPGGSRQIPSKDIAEVSAHAGYSKEQGPVESEAATKTESPKTNAKKTASKKKAVKKVAKKSRIK
jgi:hypothetical protein